MNSTHCAACTESSPTADKDQTVATTKNLRVCRKHSSSLVYRPVNKYSIKKSFKLTSATLTGFKQPRLMVSGGLDDTLHA